LFRLGQSQSGGDVHVGGYRARLTSADLGTIRSIYFEGGEAFLFYPVLLAGVRAAGERGFKVGVVTNGYWATSPDDAALWLQPMAGWLTDVSVSSDLLHYDQPVSAEARNILAACRRLGIPAATISCEVPQGAPRSQGLARGEPVVGGAVMFRGRAVVRLRRFQAALDLLDECLTKTWPSPPASTSIRWATCIFVRAW
jgi:hypothetical protein